MSRLSAYKLFPLFGLLAFSIFLSHYIVSVLRQVLGMEKGLTKQYFKITSWVALAVLLLHPSLLIGRLFLDGFGPPPGSFLNNYVDPMLKWAALLGTLSFFLFLSYELTRFDIGKRWKPWLQALSDLAMVLILIHGFALGQHLQSGWFRVVWIFYAIILLSCLMYQYFHNFKQMNNRTIKEKT